MLFVVLTSVAVGAEGDDSKVTFNAYVTQAYAQADGVSVFGISEEGTTDYRSGAVLVTFQMTEDDRILFQLASERIGDSPLAELRDDLEVDWLFFEHTFSSGTRLNAGRVPLPYGIYNETRDVGTLLEFYRPPIGIYFEGAFASETVDGFVLSQPLVRDDDWTLEADVYYGSWDRAEYIAPVVYPGTAEDAHGLQLWLETPVTGLRFGATAQRFYQTDGWPAIRSAGSRSRFDTVLLSLDGDFGRYFVRAEAQRIDTDFGPQGKVEIPAYYVMAGLRMTERFQISLLYEHSKIDGEILFVDPFYEDLAASLIYRFSSRALVRLEFHQYETIAADVAPPPDLSGLRSDVAILSLSATF